MPKLTDVDELAALVSEVTSTMCGITFASWDPLARGESLSGRMVVIAMEGERPVQIALSCDSRGSRALAAAMFRCLPAEATSARIDDAIREVLNVVAGKVGRKLNIDQRLGLPRATSLAELARMGGPGLDDGVLLRSQGDIDIRLWIFEQVKGDAEQAVSTARHRFKSLVQRLTPRSHRASR